MCIRDSYSTVSAIVIFQAYEELKSDEVYFESSLMTVSPFRIDVSGFSTTLDPSSVRMVLLDSKSFEFGSIPVEAPVASVFAVAKISVSFVTSLLLRTGLVYLLSS